jgi:hypothetical protein
VVTNATNLSIGPIAFGLRRRRSKTRHYSPRLDGRSAEARRIKSLVKLYRDHLGGAVDAIKAVDIQRLAECECLCEHLRAVGLRGESIDWFALNRFEGLTRRLRASLGLYTAIPEPPCPTIDELLAQADDEVDA